MSDDIKGDVLVIQEDTESEIKFLSACQFTKSVSNPDKEINCNRFYPRVLLATAGSIGAGLNSTDVYCVICVRYPTSIIDMVQEMGWCGRGRIVSNCDEIITDNFFLKMILDDYVYLNRRCYLPQQKSARGVVTIMSEGETINMQRSRLIDLLKMIVLRGDFWHMMLEEKIGNPLEPPTVDLTSCVDACPFCCDNLSEYIMPASCNGLSLFLVDVFINNPGGELTPSLIVKKLTQYKNIGTLVYCRPRSPKSPSPKFLNTTTL